MPDLEPANLGRRMLDRLNEAEVKIVTDTMTQLALQRAGKQAPPPLTWYANYNQYILTEVCGRTLDDYDAQRSAAILAAWAELLDLSPADKPVAGTIEYTGELDSFKVCIYAVVDRELFEAGDQRATP